LCNNHIYGCIVIEKLCIANKMKPNEAIS